MKRVFTLAIACCFLTLALPLAQATPAGTTFNLTSCHISSGCPAAGTIFGTVTLTQSGSNVLVDVVLNNGSRFVETGAGGGALFSFNDQVAGSSVTSATATLNGVTISEAVQGATNISPLNHADGTGDWSADVFCTTAADCNGGSAPNMNDLHFTVTNITLAQLEVVNDGGSFFIADILCGDAVTGCAGQTGPVDVSPTTSTPEPASLALFGSGLVGLAGVLRRKKK